MKYILIILSLTVTILPSLHSKNLSRYKTDAYGNTKTKHFNHIKSFYYKTIAGDIDSIFSNKTTKIKLVGKRKSNSFSGVSFKQAIPCFYNCDTVTFIFNDIAGIDFVNPCLFSKTGARFEVIRTKSSKKYSKETLQKYGDNFWIWHDRAANLLSSNTFGDIAWTEPPFYIESKKTKSIAGENKTVTEYIGPIQSIFFLKDILNRPHIKPTSTKTTTSDRCINYSKYDFVPEQGRLHNSNASKSYFISNDNQFSFSHEDYRLYLSFTKVETTYLEERVKRIRLGHSFSSPTKDSIIPADTVIRKYSKKSIFMAGDTDFIETIEYKIKNYRKYEAGIECIYDSDTLCVPLGNIAAFNFENNTIINKAGYSLKVLPSQRIFGNFKDPILIKKPLLCALLTLQHYPDYPIDASDYYHRYYDIQIELYKLTQPVIGGVSLNYFERMGTVDFCTTDINLLNKQIEK